jgi:hypothetical protein
MSVEASDKRLHAPHSASERRTKISRFKLPQEHHNRSGMHWRFGMHWRSRSALRALAMDRSPRRIEMQTEFPNILSIGRDGI